MHDVGINSTSMTGATCSVRSMVADFNGRDLFEIRKSALRTRGPRRATRDASRSRFFSACSSATEAREHLAWQPERNRGWIMANWLTTTPTIITASTVGDAPLET
jgi:hypothetical protein